ncbi:MAG: helix-turn-helix transcriptional regulator [Vulcanimicrobiaceae bacterium]
MSGVIAASAASRALRGAAVTLTAETAMRLARYFCTTREFWMNLQAYYDLVTAEDEKAAIIDREVQPREAVPA